MSYSSDLTRKRILKWSEKEFLEHGFQKANLRRIAEKAKVTTGALYNHFQNKEVLFDALVKDTAEEFFHTFKAKHEDFKILEDTLNVYEQSASVTDWMLAFLYDHFNVFKLISCCSEGTVYAKYIDRLIEIEEHTSKMSIRKCAHDPVDLVEDFFIHVISSMGIKNIFEVIEHDMPKE